MAEILRIERPGRPGAPQGVVIDGEIGSVAVPAAVAKELGLEVGADLDVEVLRAAIAEASPRLAKEHALRLMSHRERSCAELGRRLLRAGYAPSVVDAVVERLRELELLDDERFARMVVRSGIASRRGARRIRDDLEKAGVDPEVATVAIEAELGASDEVERAREALRGSEARTWSERERLVRRLVGRGFSLGAVLKAVPPPDSHDYTEANDDGS